VRTTAHLRILLAVLALARARASTAPSGPRGFRASSEYGVLPADRYRRICDDRLPSALFTPWIRNRESRPGKPTDSRFRSPARSNTADERAQPDEGEQRMRESRCLFAGERASCILCALRDTSIAWRAPSSFRLLATRLRRSSGKDQDNGCNKGFSAVYAPLMGAGEVREKNG